MGAVDVFNRDVVVGFVEPDGLQMLWFFYDGGHLVDNIHATNAAIRERIVFLVKKYRLDDRPDQPLTHAGLGRVDRHLVDFQILTIEVFED